MSAALIAALIFTVALLVTTAYFLMGSVPLLILKHDTVLDARFDVFADATGHRLEGAIAADAGE